jgi:hypothetical protein
VRGGLVAVASLLGATASARPAPRLALASLADDTAYPSVLAKDDDWNDPRTAAEAARLPPVLELPTSPTPAPAMPAVAHAWGTMVRATARVRLPPGERLDPAARLLGTSDVEELRLASTDPPRIEGGVVVFALAAPAPLPRRIAALTGDVRWTIVWRGHAVPLGRTRHTLLVTAGPPLAGASWPLSGRGAEPPGADHSAVTMFRLRAAVRLAEGAASPNEAALRAWSLMKRRYDLEADADVNPWSLLADDAAGQCMTNAAFVEAVFDALGFEGGRVVYVYPSLRRPKDPAATAIPNRRIPGAFTVEAPTYDVRGQFRTVAAVASPEPGQHTAALAARHQGSHGVERLKMRDARGELHNYAAAFVVDDNGVRSYYGGGYAQGPFHGADTFLAGACTAVVWAYEAGDSDEWDQPCDAPGAVLSWLTGAPLRR